MPEDPAARLPSPAARLPSPAARLPSPAARLPYEPFRPPHLTLGIPAEATPAEARAAYLELVRRHPPDREPERFRALHRAMQAFCEPLEIARDSFKPPRQTTDLSSIIAAAAARPPGLRTGFLLSLGNPPPEAAS